MSDRPDPAEDTPESSAWLSIAAPDPTAEGGARVLAEDHVALLAVRPIVDPDMGRIVALDARTRADRFAAMLLMTDHDARALGQWLIAAADETGGPGDAE